MNFNWEKTGSGARCTIEGTGGLQVELTASELGDGFESFGKMVTPAGYGQDLKRRYPRFQHADLEQAQLESEKLLKEYLSHYVAMYNALWGEAAHRKTPWAGAMTFKQVPPKAAQVAA